MTNLGVVRKWSDMYGKMTKELWDEMMLDVMMLDVMNSTPSRGVILPEPRYSNKILDRAVKRWLDSKGVVPAGKIALMYDLPVDVFVEYLTVYNAVDESLKVPGRVYSYFELCYFVKYGAPVLERQF